MGRASPPHVLPDQLARPAYRYPTSLTSEAWGPLAPSVTSYSTFAPSASDLKPSPTMLLKWTKTSFEPSSGVMKPYPFSSLNHLTVPVAIQSHLPQQIRNKFGRRCGTPVLVRASAETVAASVPACGEEYSSLGLHLGELLGGEVAPVAADRAAVGPRESRGQGLDRAAEHIGERLGGLSDRLVAHLVAGAA